MAGEEPRQRSSLAKSSKATPQWPVMTVAALGAKPADRAAFCCRSGSTSSKLDRNLPVGRPSTCEDFRHGNQKHCPRRIVKQHYAMPPPKGFGAEPFAFRRRKRTRKSP